MLEFTPGGDGLVAGVDEPMGPSGDGYASLYRIEDGSRIGELGHPEMAPLAFAPRPTTGGSMLVTTLGALAPSQRVTRDLRIEGLRGWVDPAAAGVVSPDGEWVALDGGTVATNADATRHELEGASKSKMRCFDPTSARVLGEVDGLARVWDVKTGKVVWKAVR